ncbi:hypothetical protein S7711_08077 [Stachybotrys chartarum IBT 7711]|uniref:Nucleoporin Nup120/160 n=1 Tax=Stachybotrys chartarum (strain CBS 109288 / IBT 7711) TaxID=1280523 RepID=A0A084AHM0_STACB|nr:hypothetical protein S7711_08077 [Stachybotrys chartarum IBT 7711]KFA48513.1 hypothetical protein S40293_00330 [Stachybotrys chartarum IBT 40293]
MDSGDSPFLYKETRLSLEPAASAYNITIRIPSSTAAGWSQQRITQDASSDDEPAFRLKNLATASSIYRRRWHDSPQSFLWRVLNDGTILNIRALDVSQKDTSADALLVLSIHFVVPIQPGCVAFVDPKEHDALCIYVLDQAHQLYSFTLRPEMFRKKSSIDAVLSEVAKVQKLPGLGFKHAHRMVAATEDSLLVTVNDGGLIRLDRTKGSELGAFRETFFNVQGWAQNLRSLLPFQGKRTIKHGKFHMEYSAATAVKISSLGLEGESFAVTVCLDHRMRIWNLEDGQVLYTGDLLNSDMSPQEMVKWTIDPSQSNLVRVVGQNRGYRICATYSPIGAGEFKLWRLIAKDSHNIVVEDLFPKKHLIPVTPSSSDVWTLADFVVSYEDEQQLILWTLWKNNMTYRVQRLTVDDDIGKTWGNGWESVFIETDVPTAPTSGPCDPTDVTEKWLQLILQPGRFTKATLETALSIYESGLGSSKESSSGRGLVESICSVLGSTAALERGAGGAMDFDKFRASSEIQWRRFYRLLIELDKQRGEAIGLALDPDTQLVWVVCADLVSAIRKGTQVEQLYHNLSRSSPAHSPQLRDLTRAAVSFVYGFPDSLLQLCNAVLRPELFEETTKTDIERIQYFADKSGFWRGITDEDCSQVVDILGQNFNTVTNQLYDEFLKLVGTPAEARTRNFSRPLTELGRRLYLKAAQENMEVQWRLCFSQLILLVHMEFEFDNDEDALHNRVDIGPVYRNLIQALRRLDLMRWLGNTELSLPLLVAQDKNSLGGSKKPQEEFKTMTALDLTSGPLLGCVAADEPLASSISELVSNLCAPDSDIVVAVPLVQCSLLQSERPDLALEISPYSDQEFFSVYVQGRVFLALKDFTTAAIYFRKAAVGMSSKKGQARQHRPTLLNDTEWNLLHAGSGNYYSHIATLFEQHRAYSLVTEFARLAVQFLPSDAEGRAAKTDMQSRLFNAAVATSQFDLAHTSLLAIDDHALKVSGLRKLVERMCTSYHSIDLVKLPFPGLQQDVDDFLAKKCRAIMDVVHNSQYHQVLYAWRIRRNNYRGAASVLLDRIQKLRAAGEGDKLVGDDVLDTAVTKHYLLLINALSCVDPKQAWIFDEGLERDGEASGKRKVVSLADIRKQYQDELDRIAAIQNNQFGFEADDVMEIA